ncbi:MAG TPA: hypothetical protein VNN74_05070 [Candidatus Micrarchaeia archaeon]|nr:hypothetical protein [Candidatus Micrarchaeia archaeon]
MTVHGGSSAGLGIVILAVGLLMGALAAFTLRSIWGRPPPARDPGRRDRLAEAAPPRPLHPLLRGVLSVDFGCLAVIAAVLSVLGLVLILRSIAG